MLVNVEICLHYFILLIYIGISSLWFINNFNAEFILTVDKVCFKNCSSLIFYLFLQDKKLTKEEILNNYDLFVGSQATDFGEALTRHDEF